MPTFVKAHIRKGNPVVAHQRTDQQQYAWVRKQSMALKKKGAGKTQGYKNLQAEYKKLGKRLGYFL